MIVVGAFLVLVAGGGLAVVVTREPKQQTIVLSLYGTLLAALFMALQAPDVALAEVAVGTAAVPLMLLVTLVNTQPRKPRAPLAGGKK